MASGYDLNPLVQRRRLCVELRRARQEAGLTQEQVAAEMDWSLSKIIRIEVGSVGISTNDLRALISLYRIHDQARAEGLVALARVARERGWWSSYRDIAPPGLLQLMGYETAASSIRTFEPLLVPGLLQTEEYARAVIHEFEERRPNAHIGALVEIQVRRQEIFDKADAPQLSFILDEAVVRREIGGKAVMRSQVHRLIEMAIKPNVTVEVVPFSAGAHPGLKGPFAVLEFPGSADDDVLYLEGARGDVVGRSDPAEVLAYLEAFGRVENISLGPDNSVIFLKKIMA